jgi:hypothetical protein
MDEGGVGPSDRRTLFQGPAHHSENNKQLSLISKRPAGSAGSRLDKLIVIGYAARDDASGDSVARFHGSSSPMRLIGCSAMRDSMFRKYASGLRLFSFAVAIRRSVPGSLPRWHTGPRSAPALLSLPQTCAPRTDRRTAYEHATYRRLRSPVHLHKPHHIAGYLCSLAPLCWSSAQEPQVTVDLTQGAGRHAALFRVDLFDVRLWP